MHNDTDTDAIALTWARLLKTLKREGVAGRPLSFKTLRKTASDNIRRVAGEPTQQLAKLMPAHAPRTVAAKHYTGEKDFSPLTKPLAKWRDMLVKAEVFGPVKTTKGKTK